MTKYRHYVLITLFALLLVSVISYLKKDIQLGLDLKGGSVLTYRIDTRGLSLEEASGRMANTVAVLRTRLDTYGLGEIAIEKVGLSSIRISLPGREQSDVEEIKVLLQTLGKLQFRIIAESGDSTDLGDLDIEKEMQFFEEDRANYEPPKSDDPDYPGYAMVPFKKYLRDADGHDILDDDGKPKFEMEHKLVRVDRWDFQGQDLEKLGIKLDPKLGGAGYYIVTFGIADKRENDFGNFTGPNSKEEGDGRQMAIILDGKIESAPVLNSRLTDGGYIEGTFTQAEASRLVNILRSGSLEVKPILESEYSVGPSLGEDAINKGLTAIVAGFVLVVIVLLYYYLVQGLIANLALVLNLVILIGILSFLGAALTLPGLAGIVLTVGMAVDANILIYERIREEKAKGKTLAQSVKNGYDRAFLTIVDANLTTVITALILYALGTGPVKGFAITLIIGILASMFTALAVSRLLLETLIDKGLIKDIKFTPLLFGVRHAKYMKLRPLMIGVSLLLVVGGFILFESRGEDQQDIDFTGGAEVRLRFRAPAEIAEVRSAIAKEYPDAIVVTIKSERASKEDLDLSRTSDAFMVKAKVADEPAEKRVFTEYLITTFASELMPKGGQIRDVNESDGEYERTYVSGQRMMLHFMEPTEADVVLDLLAEAGEDTEKATVLADGSWNPADADGTVRSYKIYFQTRKGTGVEALEDVIQAAKEKTIHLTEPIPGTTFIGALEAETISRQALEAVLFSLIAQIIYIAFRFKGFSFGFAAVIALVHDVSITLGIVALMDMMGIVDVKINLPIIAAFLTLIGYSMNDTIVIFDRIRENKARWKGSFSDLIDRSVNQNLARTLRTSITTFLVLAVIFVVNRGSASVLEGFSFVMLIGVIVGTYSSIFIASPMLMFLPWFWKKVDRVAPGFGGKVVLFAVVLGVAILLGSLEITTWGDAFAAVICLPVILGILRWLFISNVDRALNIALRDEKNGGKVKA